MEGYDRRGFLMAAGALVAMGAVGGAVPSSATMYNQGVDESLYKSINRVKDPAKMTGLELHHGPVIKLPAKVKKGEPFMVEVSVGRELHVTTEAHRITSVELMAGNQPVGLAVFESTLAGPRASFLVTLQSPVTLIAQARCNLHGLWEGTADVNPA